MSPIVLNTTRTAALATLAALAAGLIGLSPTGPPKALAAVRDPGCLNLPVRARTLEAIGCAGLKAAPQPGGPGLRAAAAPSGSSPAPTNSYYIHAEDAAACPPSSTTSCPVYEEGAYAVVPSGGGMVVLDFGAPCYLPNSNPRVYGAQLFGSRACSPLPSLAALARRYLQGYASTHPAGTPQLTLVLGTSNSLTGAIPAPNSLTQAQLAAHGTGWYSLVVAPVATSGLGAPVAIWGGNDIEQATDTNWYNAADTLAWVNAYSRAAALGQGVCDPAARGYLLDYGDDVVGGGPGVTDGWGAPEVYSVAWGLPGTCAMPEIYYSGLADEWQALSRWGVGHGRTAIQFTAVMADPSSGALAPDAAWAQLQALTAQAPPIRFVTVIYGGLVAPAPAVTSASPASGLPGGGTAVAIAGSGFVGVTGVSFGGTAATAFSVSSNSSLNAISPPLPPGPVDITVATSAGSSPATASARFTVLGGGVYHAQAPLRILDTRTGVGVGPDATVSLQVGGRGTVPPSGATAAVLNVTVSNPTAAGYVTVYPAGGLRPLASNLNFSPGQTVANLVEVPLGAGGQVGLYNFAGTTDLIVDLEGWVGPPAPANPAAGLYTALAPQRILDTRASRPLNPAGSINLQVAGVAGVPAAGVAAVVLNLTVTGPTSAGYLTAYPAGGGMPLASNLNFSAGQTVPNLVEVPLGGGGQVTLFNSAGLTDVVADIEGWVSDATGPAGGRLYSPLPPARILDTRLPSQPIGPNSALTLQVAGRGGAPATGVAAVVLNVTVANPTGAGYLSLYPHGLGPGASNLNFIPGQTVPNLVEVPLGAGGQIDIYNFSGSSDVIVDIEGWYS